MTLAISGLGGGLLSMWAIEAAVTLAWTYFVAARRGLAEPFIEGLKATPQLLYELTVIAGRPGGGQ